MARAVVGRPDHRRRLAVWRPAPTELTRFRGGRTRGERSQVQRLLELCRMLFGRGGCRWNVDIGARWGALLIRGWLGSRVVLAVCLALAVFATSAAGALGSQVAAGRDRSAIAITLQRHTSTAVSCQPVVVGQPTSCTATITDADAGTPGTPTGTVDFSNSARHGSFTGSPCTLSGIGASFELSGDLHAEHSVADDRRCVRRRSRPHG